MICKKIATGIFFFLFFFLPRFLLLSLLWGNKEIDW